jgi:hypothetical protein
MDWRLTALDPRRPHMAIGIYSLQAEIDFRHVFVSFDRYSP